MGASKDVRDYSGDEGMSFDLPPAMFRSAQPEAGSLPTRMFRLRNNIGLVYTRVRYTIVDGQALFEGDILLGTAQDIEQAKLGVRGIGISGAHFRWDKGVVPFVTEPALEAQVTAATDHWRQLTPFRFVKRTNEPDYISFERQNGCWSQVGRQGGKQVISLGAGCGLGAAIHEIGHALGLWHEQSRSDRDDFVTILLENVEESRKHNFDKHVLDGDDLGKYDYNSIMHYPATAFSKNGQATIVVKQTGQPIGQRKGLSSGDIAAIRMLYPGLAWPHGG